MIEVETSTRKLKILSFDLEARPLAWYGGDFVTKQPTAIAWKWVGSRTRPEVEVIGKSGRSANVLDEETDMIEVFREAYDEADVVIGHFVRDFDLKVLDGACMRLGLPVLGEKLTCCTKNDLHATSGISKSMENLSAMLEAKHQKFPMNTALWAKANMLLPEGIELAKKRVVHDVQEHVELFETMRDRGLLGPFVLWTPRSTGTVAYHA